MGNQLSKSKRRVLQIGIAIVIIASGFPLAAAILLQSIWMFLVYLPIAAFILYFLYVRLYQKKETRYPIVPPEGKTDIYFPRTDIPRPIHADFRKTEEKKRKLAKIERPRRKKR